MISWLVVRLGESDMDYQREYYQTPDGKFHVFDGGGFNPGFGELDAFPMPVFYSPLILIPLLLISYAVIIYLFGLTTGIICFFGPPVVIAISRETLPPPKLYTEAEIHNM